MFSQLVHILQLIAKQPWIIGESYLIIFTTLTIITPFHILNLFFVFHILTPFFQSCFFSSKNTLFLAKACLIWPIFSTVFLAHNHNFLLFKHQNLTSGRLEVRVQYALISPVLSYVFFFIFLA